MPRLNSSTSSSSSRTLRIRAVLATGAWTLLFLTLADIAVGLAFPWPADPRQQPGSLQSYFGYGQSIEAKLHYLVRPTDAASAQIVSSGWIDRECRHVPTAPPPGKLGVTVYGMSFSEHVRHELGQLDKNLVTTGYAGPGAPLSHSYACFQAVSQTGRDPNQVQIIGILASSVKRMLTIGGVTTTFEAPAPFTYPRYTLERGRLSMQEPVVRGPADLRNPVRWSAYKAQLAQVDSWYDPVLMQASPLDRSVFVGLLRRAYAQAEDRRLIERLVYDGHAFTDNPQLGPVMKTLLLDFAARVRGQGKLPIVILFQDRGSGADSLYGLLGPTLEKAGVPVVTTHAAFSVNDSRNFIADGHFTPEVDRAIARIVLAQINAARPSLSAIR